MSTRDLLHLLLLGATWGASFLWMRVAAPEFGAAPLTALRVIGGVLVLWPLVSLAGLRAAFGGHGRSLVAVGLFGAALPYACFGLASQHVSAASASLLNATTPLFAALLGALAWRQRLQATQVAGLAIGFAGVAIVVQSRGGIASDGTWSAVGMAACVVAAASYGWAANLARHRLTPLPPLAVAAATQGVAALACLPPAIAQWPADPPSWPAWGAVLGLAVLCTGWANVLYFRLIASVGASRATMVTYLVPAFAALWAYLVLGEPLTAELAAGGAIILAGCGVAAGLPGLGRLRRAAGRAARRVEAVVR